ncbi:MAG: hypothetical protein HGA25_08370, partial [Clostridiales bacterium]|nr:hypothetical protein [Clostridiales bacterium]
LFRSFIKNRQLFVSYVPGHQTTSTQLTKELRDAKYRAHINNCADKLAKEARGMKPGAVVLVNYEI